MISSSSRISECYLTLGICSSNTTSTAYEISQFLMQRKRLHRTLINAVQIHEQKAKSRKNREQSFSFVGCAVSSLCFYETSWRQPETILGLYNDQRSSADAQSWNQFSGFKRMEDIVGLGRKHESKASIWGACDSRRLLRLRFFVPIFENNNTETEAARMQTLRVFKTLVVNCLLLSANTRL